jgi:hypothetical protein
MSNWVDAQLDVLAELPEQLNAVQASLHSLVIDLLTWLAVWSHIHLVSRRFPTAVFSIGYWDESLICSGKRALCAGRVVCGIHDGGELGLEWSCRTSLFFFVYRAERWARVGAMWS